MDIFRYDGGPKTAYVVSDSAEEAHNLVENGWDTEDDFVSKDWTKLCSPTNLSVLRNPYKIEPFTGMTKRVEEWIRTPWEEIPDGQPWIIIDHRLGKDDQFHADAIYVVTEEDTSDTQLAVRRDCPCKGKNKCPVCGGEGTVTKWLDAAISTDGESYVLNTSDVDEAFELLDAYSTILDQGYKLEK